MYTFEEPFKGTCRRIDLGCFTGRTGTVEMGVDFVEETVDEEIVTALPDDGGMTCFGAGVDGVCLEGRGLFSCWWLVLGMMIS
jgi:hypothetical protein